MMMGTIYLFIHQFCSVVCGLLGYRRPVTVGCSMLERTVRLLGPFGPRLLNNHATFVL